MLHDGTQSFTPGISSTSSQYFLHDRLGTVMATVGQTQATNSTNRYDAFGVPISQTGMPPNPFGFAGAWGYQEDASGLKLLGHRYYDPSTGRFLTRDPIQDGRNWYSYVDNNPLNYADPSGLRPITGGDRARLHRLRNRMATEGFSPGYINQVTNELKAEILSVSGTDPKRLRALWWAIDHLGDKSYGSSRDGINKCNIFVYASYLDGASVPMPDRRPYFPGTQEYGANVLGDPGTRLDHLSLVGSGLPGDIYAFGNRNPSASGHATLKVAGGLLIYAGTDDVKLGSFGRNQQGHKPVVRWRHR